MIIDTYSDKLHQKRRKTRRAFLLSVVLHILSIALTGIGYIQWYHPMHSPESLVNESIEVTTVQRFHTSSPRKRSMASRRTVSSTSMQVTETNVVQPMNSARPVTSSESVMTLGTDADLPFAETPLSAHATKSPKLKPITSVQTKLPSVAPPTEIIQQQIDPSQTNSESVLAKPVDRDGMMGDALEGIAESVAESDDDSDVDIVFLLDISGSMIDNIRAVGRQLGKMVSVFGEKGIDFRLGIVIFRYLDDDTIYHELTRDVDKYQQLLTSHVVAAAGDERAHNAIIKAIRRANFRDGVKRRFVLVTDEASKGSYKLLDVLRQCQQNQITVDVIGINDTTHLALSSKTGGLWYPIPIQE